MIRDHDAHHPLAAAHRGRGRIRSLLLRRRRAQALTEFAIVVPVMVTCLLFAMYFYEIIQIKIKNQEVGRFAAWEFTAFPLHDYEKGEAKGFSDAKSEINQVIDKQYANLKSTDKHHGDAWLMVGWDPPKVTMKDQKEPKIPGGSVVNTVFNVLGYALDAYSALSLQHANPMLMLMMGLHKVEQQIIFGARFSRFNPPGRWGFNTKGYPKVKSRIRYKNLLVPKYFMDGQGSWFSEGHFQAKKRRFTENVAVVADSWRLHHGDSVPGPLDVTNAGTSTAYYKQVERMAWVTPTIKDVVKGVHYGLTAVLLAYFIAAGHPPLTVDPTETTLVSVPYKPGKPGTVEINQDNGKVPYDTSPYNGEYKGTLDLRGPHFMGCQQEEALGCFPSLSSDNPFGPYILPPENP
ncbi:hypothetical protein ACFL51_01810 [Myxococcota bacterium]